jgi:EH domain-containing protein 1
LIFDYLQGFLNKFEVVMCPSPILESIYFIDTPGVLSGEKQRIGRSYQFPQVIEWFAARSDRILLLFDAHKLDISDEFSDAIKMLKGHDDKIRVILNKCDLVTNQQLMRVYGALMWSLGKVVNTPEVLRVYVGSFWDQPYAAAGRSNSELFDREANDLLSDLRSLPRNSAIRKINELIKRCRQSKTHALLIAHLKGKMPGWFGKSKKQAKMLDNLVDEFREVQRKYSLPPGDFPNVQRFRAQLTDGGYELDKFPKLKGKMIEQMDHVLSVEIPTLMRRLPGIEALKSTADVVDAKDASNPFAATGAMNSAHAGKAWVVSGPQKAAYDNVFETLPTQGGKATGTSCRQTMINSGLDQAQLGSIWNLSDIDKDGCLDRDEFALCMFLMEEVAAGGSIHAQLPKNYIPPAKRNT